MPMFKDLTEKDVEALVAFIKSRSSKWRQEAHHAAPVEVPALPEWFGDEERRKREAGRGRELFQVTCAACHGPEGDGRGAVATELRDAWGDEVVMPDLRGTARRCGPGPRDIYRVLVTGLSGTPMPSFLEATTEEQRWQLVAFLVE
jgi:mono/diheme cytochrome c family protein